MLRSTLYGFALLLLAATAQAQETLALADVAAVKDATVLILRTDADDGRSSSGSGFLIRVDGQTGYIVTNHHVIGARRGGFRDQGTIKIVFRAGTKTETKVAAEIVATSPEKDLAILKVVDVRNLPSPIDVQKPTDLVETMPVYLFGFPFGESLLPNQGKISVVVGKGSVSSVRRDAEGVAHAVLIDGALNPGNSGGPVVDTKGRLVGIAVATIVGAHIGIAIAPEELLSLLEGRVEGLNLTVGELRGKTVDVMMDARLVDPLGRIQSLSLLHSVGVALPVKTKQEKAWKPLPGATRTVFKISDQSARGTVPIAYPSNSSLDLVYQLVTTDKLGHSTYAKPCRYLLGTATSGRLEAWGEVLNLDGDCKIQVEKGSVSIEVPGTYHDLNSELGKFNSPRIIREIDGDFVVQVKVCGDFQPAAPTTRDSAVPSSGAGVVLWVDDETFVRFERFGVLRNDRVSPFLLFERRELGQVKTNHNGRIVAGDVYLRIERHDNQITGSSSSDGEHWTQAKPMDLDWPSRIKVGFNAVSSSFDPFVVRFEEFSIRKPDAEAKK